MFGNEKIKLCVGVAYRWEVAGIGVDFEAP
jgi:hypothetical protein